MFALRTLTLTLLLVALAMPSAAQDTPKDEPKKEEPKKEEPKKEKSQQVPMATKLAELGNLQGVVPVIHNTGQTGILSKRYPRREVCWVLDRNAGRREVVRTTHLFLLTEDSKLAYEDAAGRRFGNYTEATVDYDTTQMLRINDPTPLKLYQHRDIITSVGKVSANESNRLLYWGSYRHRGELRLLAPAIEAFHAAIKEGKIQFDPSRPDRLEVQWGEENGEPVVRAVHFSPANAPPVRLK